MDFSIIYSVDYKRLQPDGTYNFGLRSVKFDAVSSDDDREICEKLHSANIYTEFYSPKPGIDRILDERIALSELVEDEGFNIDHGGIALSLGGLIQGDLYIALISGTENYSIIQDCLDDALNCEHLYVQFSFNARFSRYEVNEYIKRPVTLKQFESGTTKFEPRLPLPQLVRKRDQ